jgi:2-dehydro-3-deoxyphosphogluconate aldolase/(4S)-4-hydroxy-2-oxoglutarate aldolase
VPSPVDLRRSAVAERIRRERLIVVLRRVEPQERLLALVDELREAGAGVFEVTFDSPMGQADLTALRDRHPDALVGAGTLRTADQLASARDAGAAFGVSPVLDPGVVDAALAAGLPFLPGAYTPTEVDLAWHGGATFVKLFPASSLGPQHVREIRGPLPEVEVVPTGGIDASNAAAYLGAGAVAVGIGSAFVRATPAERRAIVEATRAR